MKRLFEVFRAYSEEASIDPLLKKVLKIEKQIKKSIQRLKRASY